MNRALIVALLAWSAVVNLTLLMLWLVVFITASDFIFSFHSDWLAMSAQQVMAIHYVAMLCYATMIVLLNVIPWGLLQCTSRITCLKATVVE